MPIPMGYRAIASDLRARIRAGEYPPGEPLPTYAELADLYAVSVTTMQRAARELMHDGLLVGVQGRRLYVPDQLPTASDDGPAPRSR